MAFVPRLEPRGIRHATSVSHSGLDAPCQRFGPRLDGNGSSGFLRQQ
jgi:hypothetical protein